MPNPNPPNNLPGPGPGRPKGAKNKATEEGRRAIAEFVDGNAHRLVEWLDRMAAEDPEAAFKAFMSVVEYHIPKLQRSEVTGKDGEAIKHEHDISKILEEIDGQSLPKKW